MLVGASGPDETEEWISAASGETIASDSYAEIKINISIGKALSGIFLNFITKRLFSANIENWYKSRVAAYAEVCSLRITL
jgi:hypothetical protein